MNVSYHCSDVESAKKLISCILSMGMDFKVVNSHDKIDVILYVDSTEIHNYLLEFVPNGWHSQVSNDLFNIRSI